MSKIVKPVQQNVEKKNISELVSEFETSFGDYVPELVSKTKEISQEMKLRCDAFAIYQSSTDFTSTTSKYIEGKAISLPMLYEKIFKMGSTTRKASARRKINNPEYIPLSKALHLKGLQIEQIGHQDFRRKEIWYVWLKPLKLEEYQVLDNDGNIVVKEGWLYDDQKPPRYVKKSEIGKKVSEILITQFVEKQLNDNDEEVDVLVKYESPIRIFADKGSDKEKKILDEIEKARVLEENQKII